MSGPQGLGLPHIVHILADDFGWSEVGYHRANTTAIQHDVSTPNLDELASNGLILDRFYVHKICSPSRCALQSGRDPIHVNVVNVAPEVRNVKDPVGGYQGIPTNMTCIAEHLRSAGYKTHAVGKWDVGMATRTFHHPRARGYDSWLGYWHHANDYWSQGEGSCPAPNQNVKDLWAYNETFDGPALWLANGATCSQAKQTPAAGEACVFEDTLFVRHVVNVLRDHAALSSEVPLFLFWSMHLVHMPLEVPQAWLDKFAFIDDEHRRLGHAMGALLDANVGTVVSELKALKLWDNAVVVFHSDNGGEILGAGLCGGNNWPLRGGKFANWEGGIRVNAWVSGGRLPAARRGAIETGFIAISDWYSTYCALAGVDPTDAVAAAAGLPGVDGVNAWPLISGSNSTSARKEVVIGDTTAVGPNEDGKARVGGLISGRFKLLVGAPDKLYIVGQDAMTGPSWPNSTSHLVPMAHSRTCGRAAKRGCLFDIFSDPSESTNLALVHPDVFTAMLARIDTLQEGVYTPDRGTTDKAACEQVVANGGYWGPWLDREQEKEQN